MGRSIKMSANARHSWRCSMLQMLYVVFMCAILTPIVAGTRIHSHPGRYVTENATTDVCASTQCGSNSDCHVTDGMAMCLCRPGYSGDPYVACQEITPLRNGCKKDSDCDPHLMCISNECRYPCDMVCGRGAQCNVVNHSPVCSCPSSTTGNPFVSCSPIREETNHVLYLRRAAARSLTIQIPCIKNDTCNITQLEYGVHGSKDMSSILGSTVAISVKESKDASIEIQGLKTGTKYVVRAIWTRVEKETNSSNSKQLQARTCQAHLPVVTGLRVVKAGPGWIDLRWTPLRDENCYSNIIYYVRYKVEDAEEEGDWLHFGIYFMDGIEVFRPTHPCDGWPGEFCVLLTDSVKPGMKHLIEVVGVRYDAIEFKKNGPMNFPPEQINKTYGQSDGRLQGSYTWGKADGLTPCYPAPKPPPPSSEDAPIEERSRPSGIRMNTPVWVLVLVVVGLLMLIVGVSVGLWRWHKSRGNESRDGLTNPSNLQTSTPDVCQSTNRPTVKFESRPLPTPSRASNIYDDCLDGTRPGTVYERLRERATTFKPQPQHPFENNSEARKRLNSSGTDQPKMHKLPSLDDNQYVPMKSPPPLYDDAEDILTRNGDRSSDYIAPRQLPTYIEVVDQEVATPGYNRPYSTLTSKWKAWT